MLNNEINEAEELIDYIYKSPTAFHAVENAVSVLEKSGFVEIKEEDSWKLQRGGKYFVTKNQSALIAFVVGNGELEKHGFRIIGAHTDSPGFRIKPNADMNVEDAYVKLNAEVYGGPILNTWMDRPLSIAGRVVLKGRSPFEPNIRFINIQRPVVIIPNLAIHMNRDVNSGIKLNRQKHLLPLLSLVNDKFEKDKYLVGIVAEELSVSADDILDFDLYLYEFEKGSIIGANREFISSGRLDDLSMVYSGIKSISSAGVNKSTSVMVCFDNEEVGSSTKQGADSPMLLSVLERISFNLGKNKDDFYRALARSFIISCDLGHALHPNYQEKSDPVNRPVINRGPIIKISANQSYTTDGVSGAIYREICSSCGIPVQVFVNRSDERGGSTIGPISSSHINITSVDMGLAILSMHSIRELCGIKDYVYSLESFRKFYDL